MENFKNSERVLKKELNHTKGDLVSYKEKCIQKLLKLKSLLEQIDNKYENSSLKLVSGLTAVTLFSTVAAISTSNNSPKSFEDTISYYTTDGSKSINGSVDYDTLKKCVIIELKLDSKQKIYIAQKFSRAYYDIFTNECICENDSNIIALSKVDDYLNYYNEVQIEYSNEDIQRIYEEIEEDYEYNEFRQVVKERK